MPRLSSALESSSVQQRLRPSLDRATTRQVEQPMQVVLPAMRAGLGATLRAESPEASSAYQGFPLRAMRHTAIVAIAAAAIGRITTAAEYRLAQIIPGLPASHWAFHEFAQHDWLTVLDAGLPLLGSIPVTGFPKSMSRRASS